MMSDCLHRGGRQPLVAGVLAEVHERHSRRLRGTRSLRQQVLQVARGCRIFKCFQRWRRGAENDRHSCTPGSYHREVARRVTEPFVLLIRCVVFLVHYDEGEFRQRREHR